MKLKFFSLITFLILIGVLTAEEHPGLFITKQEGIQIRESLEKYPLLKASFIASKDDMDRALINKIEVPAPGEAGGYAHEKHKQNYREMTSAGILYKITGDERYALFIKDMLYSYAEMYPKLGPHPLSHNQRPGKLFHQTLNETVWLVYTSIAYDCIYNWLTPDDRKHIEDNIFKHMIHLFTVEHTREFNRIHNHGTWTVAAVGMLGYVLKDKNLVEMALYGTEKDGQGGFLKQLDLLFSPDGYYMEGPYYIRYALRPFFFFAEAIERFEPQRKIFEYRDGILKKVHYAAMQTAFPNGVFPPINDASRTMDVKAIGPIVSNNIVYSRYGADQNLLAIASMQNKVILNNSGLQIAKDISTLNSSLELNWPSIEFRDGFAGDQGGLGILRTGSGEKQTMLLMKYGVHGSGHGHFDKLHFSLFDQGSEVIFDYGYARWVNIETKFGGRYLPENTSYAKQTIAHNTVTVDQESQNKGKRKAADKVAGESHFFHSAGDIQVMSARSTKHYPGVLMQRTMFLITDSSLHHPLVVDLFKLQSSDEHEYDYAIHYNGQLMTTNLKYKNGFENQTPLGDDFGYQHLWKTASGNPEKPFSLSWLNGKRYYSLITSSAKGNEVFLGRSGANDPNFNLRSEPLAVIRKKAKNHLFSSVIEPHGYYSEASEKSVNAHPAINSIQVIGSNEIGSVVEIKGDNIHWRIMVTNQEASTNKQHKLEFDGLTYEWQGNFKFIDMKN